MRFAGTAGLAGGSSLGHDRRFGFGMVFVDGKRLEELYLQDCSLGLYPSKARAVTFVKMAEKYRQHFSC